jgi:hypothetical protein
VATNHKPIIGAWYLNLRCQFLKVWGMVYNNGEPDKIVLHYLNGMRFIIELEDWRQLDLLRYPTENKQRSRATQS